MHDTLPPASGDAPSLRLAPRKALAMCNGVAALMTEMRTVALQTAEEQGATPR